MEVELELLFSTIQYNYKWAYYMSHHKISTMPNPIQQSNLFFFFFFVPWVWFLFKDNALQLYQYQFVTKCKSGEKK